MITFYCCQLQKPYLKKSIALDRSRYRLPIVCIVALMTAVFNVDNPTRSVVEELMAEAPCFRPAYRLILCSRSVDFAVGT